MSPPKRPCDACGRPTDSPRRGLCPVCWALEPDDAIPVLGSCATCGERRRILMRWTRLRVGRVLTCHNCGHVADQARPRPLDVPALRALLTRDRRNTDRRRGTPTTDGKSGRRRRVRRAPDRIGATSA